MESAVTKIIEALIQIAPSAIDWIDRVVRDERARRVETVRTTNHSVDAIDELKRDRPSGR